MKTLILIRHAHALSAWDAHVAKDAQRPLSEQGLQKAAATAKQLATLNVHPQIILTSPLVRAVQTAEIVAQQLAAPVRAEEMLNGFAADDAVADFLLTQLDHKDTVLAVGHNPNITCVCHALCKQVRPFSPGDFAVLKFDDTKTLQDVYFGEKA